MFRPQRMNQRAELEHCFPGTVKYRKVHPDRLCRSAPSQQTGKTEKAVETMPVDVFTPPTSPPPISTRVREFTFGRKLLGGKGLSSRFVARRRSSSAPLGSGRPLQPHTWATAQPRCVGNFSSKPVFLFIHSKSCRFLTPALSLFCRRSL